MTTMAQVVTGAFEVMNKIAVGGSPGAGDAAYGLGVLNDMLHGWRGRGVDIGHETLSGSETINLLEEHIEGVKMLLAVHPRMARRYGFAPDPDLKRDAEAAMSSIFATYAGPKPAPQDIALARMPLQVEKWGR